MTLELTLAIVIAVGTAGVGLYAIYRWGPGMACRRLRCPEKQQRCEIAVLRGEGTFCSLVETDVLACTLLPGGVVDCSKACLRR